MEFMNGSNAYPVIKTDETVREILSHGNETYPFQYYLEDIWQFDLHRIDWHWHPELEFVYIQQGTADIFIGSSRCTLTAGQGVFINAQTIHRFESTASAIIPNIVFSPSLLASKESRIYQKYIQPVLNSGDYQIFSSDIPWQKEILDILNSVFTLQADPNTCELKTVTLLLRLWQTLYEHVNPLCTEQNDKRSIQNRARLQILLQYIHENYRNTITLEKLAEEIALSKSSVLNIFKKNIQMSPIDYIIHYRMKQAAHLLETTENTVLSIAQSLGFDNEGYFCRKFKDIFGSTPVQYRKSKQ